MKVLVLGGGIGGLACAQGLLRQGMDVRVVERDVDVTATAGYKLHLGTAVVRALRELLTAEQLELLLTSAVATRGFALVVRDHRGRRLLRATEPSDDLTLDVDRTTLRRVLASGLGERLRCGRSAVGWEHRADSVVARLDDGQRVEADVVVIADGAGSALAARLAGRPTSTPCGLVAVAGRTRWDEVPRSARSMLGDEPLLAVGPGGTGLFASAHDPVGRAAIRSARPPVVADPCPVVIWGLLALAGSLPHRTPRPTGEQLVTDAATLLGQHRWAPGLVDLLRRCDPASVTGFGLPAADPDDIAPWPAGRVTALGDAVHAMPPTGGQGAGTAVLDAHDLVQALSRARRGEITVPVAVHDYEARMRPRGAAAVRESLQPLAWIRATAGPAGSRAFRAISPVASGVANVAGIWGRRR